MKYTPREFQEFAVRSATHENLTEWGSDTRNITESLEDYLEFAERRYGDDARHHIGIKEIEKDLGSIIAQVATLGADLELNLERIMTNWVDANYENYTV